MWHKMSFKTWPQPSLMNSHSHIATSTDFSTPQALPGPSCISTLLCHQGIARLLSALTQFPKTAGGSQVCGCTYATLLLCYKTSPSLPLECEFLKGRDDNLIPTISGPVPDTEKASSVWLFEGYKNNRINRILSQKSGVSIFHRLLLKLD